MGPKRWCTYIIHLLRASLGYAGRQILGAMAKALKPVYTASTEAAAKVRFAEFIEVWGNKYPALGCESRRGRGEPSG